MQVFAHTAQRRTFTRNSLETKIVTTRSRHLFKMQSSLAKTQVSSYKIRLLVVVVVVVVHKMNYS